MSKREQAALALTPEADPPHPTFQVHHMSDQRASGPLATRSTTPANRGRRGLVNADSPTIGLRLTHGLAPLFAGTGPLLPVKLQGTLIKR